MHQMDGLPMMVSGRRINITERGSYIIRMVQYGKREHLTMKHPMRS